MILNNNRGITSEEISLLVSSEVVTNLTRLHLSGCEISGEGVKAIANSTKLTQLTSLNLNGTRINEHYCKVLSNSSVISKMKYFSVSRNHLGPVGAKHLFDSQYLSNVTTLDISENDGGGEMIQSFSSCSNLPNLMNLDAHENNVRALGVEYLCKSSHRFPKLKKLIIGLNKFVKQGALELIRSFPHLTILNVYLHPGYCTCTHSDITELKKIAETSIIKQVYLDVLNGGEEEFSVFFTGL